MLSPPDDIQNCGAQAMCDGLESLANDLSFFFFFLFQNCGAQAMCDGLESLANDLGSRSTAVQI